MWNPFRRVSAVVVRKSGLVYMSRRQARGVWRCGRCGRGEIREPEAGSRCPACQAEVVAVQRGADVWTLLLVLVVLVAAWVALAWWR